jgi:hypothetical protein
VWPLWPNAVSMTPVLLSLVIPNSAVEPEGVYDSIVYTLSLWAVSTITL